MKRTLVAVALAVVFVMALAVPALAQSLTLTTSYEMDGTIDLEKQAGHKCNTGAAIKQTIAGSGVMDKTQTVSMVAGRIMMEDDNNWVAGATPLTVTTVWDLCLPAKYVDADGDVVPVGALTGDALYGPAGQTDWSNFDALTDQIYAVQIQADPGFSGNLYQNGVAAQGPYGVNLDAETPPDLDLDYEATSTDIREAGLGSSWFWGYDKYGQVTAMTGPDFVGSFFNIEQHGRTSQGTQRRYISLSSPFSHAYLTEDMSVVGRSEIHDVVALGNLAPGAEMPGDWWALF